MFSLLFISPILFLFLIIQIDIVLTQTLLLGYFFFATSGIPFIYWIFSRRNNPQKAGFAFRVSSIFALFNLCLISLVLLVVSLFTDEALHRILTGFFIQSFIYFTPLLLPALGGLFSERSGVINIGLEGIMLSAAFLGVFGSWISQNPWFGLMTGVIVGGLIGLVYAILCIRFHADQIIVGVAVNLVALGVTNFIYKWSGDSRSPLFGLQDSQHIQGLPTILEFFQMIPSFWTSLGNIPGLEFILQPIVALFLPIVQWAISWIAGIWSFLLGIPILGPIFLNHNILIYLAIFLAILAHVVLFKTPIGLRLRAVGEHARAADSVGISVSFWRYAAVTFSGLIAGLGGVFLSLGWLTGTFSKDMAAGRGFIAIAAYIFGNWSVIGTSMACLLFGVFYAFVDVLKAQETIAFPVFFPLPNADPFVGILPINGAPSANLQMLIQSLFTGFYGNAGIVNVLPTVNILSTYFVEMVPFLLTIIALSGAILWKTRPPAEVGKPFIKGGKD